MASILERLRERKLLQRVVLPDHLSLLLGAAEIQPDEKNVKLAYKGGTGSLRHCLAGADRFLMELLMRLVDRQNVDGHTENRRERERSTGDRPGANDALARTGRVHSLTSPLAAA